MHQHIKHCLSTPRLTRFFPKTAFRLLLAALCLWATQTATAAPAGHGQPPQPTAFALGDTIISATICANETYDFNGESLDASGQYTAVLEGSDGSDSTITLNLSVLPVSASSTSATICAGETYEFHGQTLDADGTYTAVLESENGCDSTITLTLNVLENVSTQLSAAICEGTSITFQGESLDETGIYEKVLTAENGCDSTVTLNLTVAPFFNTNLSATICAGESYTFGDTTLALAGIYTDTLTALGGCDSVLILNLHVLPNITTQLNVGICTGSEYTFDGDVLDASGVYIKTYTAANGCDSTAVLNLVVADQFDISLNATICDGETYTFGDDILDSTGEYVRNLQAAGGCDSTVTLNLTVLPVLNGNDTGIICAGDTLQYGGQSFTDAGTYEVVLTASTGCDSLVVFQVTVLPVPHTELEATICEGETYVFQNTTLDESGIFEAVLEAENGCDSIVTLDLTVLPAIETEITASICAGESYVYGDDTLDVAGEYPYVFPAENGCDSTVTIVLNVLPVQATELEASICAGETYTFGSDELTDAGTYTQVLEGENGCDSTVTLVLEVLPVASSHEDVTICQGTPYLFDGELLDESGEYTGVFTAENGCDSTVTLTLTVLPLATSTLEATICANEFYEYEGQTLTNAGTYIFTFDGSNGCDSVVTLQLTVLPVAETTIEVSICNGETYEYNGEDLTETGLYPFVLTAENGCDSTVTIDLTVFEHLTTNLSVTVCTGTTYEFNGETLDTDGVYTANFTGSNGCDSTVVLTLGFVPGFETLLEASICAGSSYEFGNENLTSTGVYTLTLESIGGCDSIVTLTLTVLPQTESTTNATVCAGETYTFNGETYTASGTYTAVLTGSNGCDSTAVLNLSVLPTASGNLSVTTCSSEPYEFDGELLNQSGVYTAVFTGANGCDSTVVLNLTVLPVSGSSFDVSICPGDSYVYNGQSLTAAGAYEFTLDGANGCDSTVVVNLTVLPNAESAFAAVVCDGESYTFNNQTLTVSGIYEFTFPNASANGCDSLVTLYLTIFPAIPPTETTASICEGSSYDFYGTPLTQPGEYTAHLPSSTGCDSIIVLTLTIAPNITLVEAASICSGDTYSFHGQTLSAPGVYTAVLPGTVGCDTIATLTLSVRTVNTTVTVQDGTLTAAANDATFQWVNCSDTTLIIGANASSFTPQATGLYAVVVMQNGCVGVSDCKFVQVVGTNEPIAATAWSLQPNPARRMATVNLTETLSGKVRLDVFDAAGRLLRSLTVAPDATQVEVDLTGLPDGLLLVRLSDERGASTKRLVKAEE